MAIIRVRRDEKTNEIYIETSLKGKPLLTIPQINKGTAYTEEERWEFDLIGKLPYSIETIEQQEVRAYKQFSRFNTDLEKHIYLRNLHGTNETLFYKLVKDHLEEMLPIVYTPTVGEAVRKYSLEFRKPRGLYISYPDRHKIKDILKNRTNLSISLIVASDAEGVLGIGDQGVGGMEIPVAKLMVYTLCAGFNPNNYLPVFLDAGTNNQELLDDPLYLGWRHKRVSGKEYDEMIKLFVEAVKDEFPGVFLHWEDFGRDNARKNLEKYQDELCSFNDDMQGTAVVTVAALLSAIKASKLFISDHRIVVYGAGTAGVGITDEIVKTFMRMGLSKKAALEKFWLIDRNGLLHEGMKHSDEIAGFQKPYVRDKSDIKGFEISDNGITLAEVVKQVRPTILIGCSTVAGAFTQDIIKDMASDVERPIIFPLSNPTRLAEATPEDLLTWTEGKALVATGSPFPPVINSRTCVARVIAQSNNALAFPGIGLGVIAVKAKKLTDEMLWVATEVICEMAPVHDNPTAPILPPLGLADEVSEKVAFEVAKQAVIDGVAEELSDEEISERIKNIQWKPQYYEYRWVSE
jgi:malate dehydrogenase (oxaloacetate-decarboxylating)